MCNAAAGSLAGRPESSPAAGPAERRDAQAGQLRSRGELERPPDKCRRPSNGGRRLAVQRKSTRPPPPSYPPPLPGQLTSPSRHSSLDLLPSSGIRYLMPRRAAARTPGPRLAGTAPAPLSRLAGRPTQRAEQAPWPGIHPAPARGTGAGWIPGPRGRPYRYRFDGDPPAGSSRRISRPRRRP